MKENSLEVFNSATGEDYISSSGKANRCSEEYYTLTELIVILDRQSDSPITHSLTHDVSMKQTSVFLGNAKPAEREDDRPGPDLGKEEKNVPSKKYQNKTLE